eukprot:TRINITY_DN18866_c0_g1_i1.p1 TRINITY_DN18866_c0_g1~~TRINITY_DN18866_c0_g1_i1.p1  ORF type:complete len:156 (-),score=24.19 TRINITY_DN18866_c0_g1_i1:78-545(-)
MYVRSGDDEDRPPLCEDILLLSFLVLANTRLRAVISPDFNGVAPVAGATEGPRPWVEECWGERAGANCLEYRGLGMGAVEEGLIVAIYDPAIPNLPASAANGFLLYGPLSASPAPVSSLLSSWEAVSYTHLRAHETPEHLVCRLLLEKKKKYTKK